MARRKTRKPSVELDGKMFVVDYEITEAGNGREMSGAQLRKFLKVNGGQLTKDEGEFEDDYVSDDIAFLRNTVISWKPLEQQ